MEDRSNTHHGDLVSYEQQRTPVRDLQVFGIGSGKFTALRLKALVNITSALEAELRSMESDVLSGDQGVDGINFYEAVESFEKNLILATLTLERGNQSRAARRLSLGITTLNTMLKRHGINPRMYKSVIG